MPVPGAPSLGGQVSERLIGKEAVRRAGRPRAPGRGVGKGCRPWQQTNTPTKACHPEKPRTAMPRGRAMLSRSAVGSHVSERPSLGVCGRQALVGVFVCAQENGGARACPVLEVV